MAMIRNRRFYDRAGGSRWVLPFAIFPFLLLPSPACEAAPSHAAPADSLRFPVRRIATIPASLDLQFRTVPAVAWVGDSSLAVLDSDDGQVVIIPLFGGSELRFGRKGSGPGEFQLPIAIIADSNGLVVADATTRRVTRFDRHMKVSQSQPLPGMPLHLLRLAGNRLTLAWVGFGMAGPEIGEIDLSSGGVNSAWRPFAVSPDLAQASEGLEGPSPFIAAATDGAGRLVLGGGTEYRIFRFDGSHVTGEFGRSELEPEHLSADERQELASRMQRVFGAQAAVDASAIDQVLDRPKPFYNANALATDPAGRVWVVTTRRSRGGTPIDVFDSEGRYLGTFTMKDKVQKLAIRGNRIAALVERTSGATEGQFGIDIYEVGQART